MPLKWVAIEYDTDFDLCSYDPLNDYPRAMAQKLADALVDDVRVQDIQILDDAPLAVEDQREDKDNPGLCGCGAPLRVHAVSEEHPTGGLYCPLGCRTYRTWDEVEKAHELQRGFGRVIRLLQELRGLVSDSILSAEAMKRWPGCKLQIHVSAAAAPQLMPLAVFVVRKDGLIQAEQMIDGVLAVAVLADAEAAEWKPVQYAALRGEALP